MLKPTCAVILAVLGGAPLNVPGTSASALERSQRPSRAAPAGEPAAAAESRLGAARPALDPPSSLKPRAARTKIRIAHSHQRVVACVSQRKGAELRCRGTREEADSTTSLTLRPRPAPPTPGKAVRRAVRVSFASHIGQQEQEIELDAGPWELDWPGHKRLERFKASPNASIQATLRTTTGKCTKRQQSCMLSTDSTLQEVSIATGQ
jgi:hypothetical protein